MSFDMELYEVDHDKENEYDGTRLRVQYKGNTIGFAGTFAAAYDIMEEHANSPCMSIEVSADTRTEPPYMSDMADMEQQIIDLAQEVEYMESERDYWKELSEHVNIAVDKERKRSWNENKAFQWELAEENAILRAQLAEKHDDNARLQRSLAEEHNKLKVALQLDSKEPEACTTLRVRSLETQLERLTSMVETQWAPQSDVDFKDHAGTDYWWQTETDYKEIVNKVNTLWEERYDS